MMMKNIVIKRVDCPIKYEDCGYGPSELDEYDVDKIPEGAKIYHNYSTGSYEGGGHAIIINNGLFYHCDLGHCSCNGPMEHFRLNNGSESLDHLKQSMSEELKQECKPLFDAIEAEAQ